MTWLLLAQTEEPNIFSYFGESNLAGKAIVVALLVFSLVAWTIMIGKYLDLSRLRSLNRSFESRLSQQRGLLKLNLGRKAGSLGPYASLVEEAVFGERACNACFFVAGSVAFWSDQV